MAEGFTIPMPTVLFQCEWCEAAGSELNCYPPEEVRYSRGEKAWLCDECFSDRPSEIVEDDEAVWLPKGWPSHDH